MFCLNTNSDSYLKPEEVSRDAERKLEKVFDLFINDILECSYFN